MAPSLLQISIMMFGVVLPVMLLAEVLRREGRELLVVAVVMLAIGAILARVGSRDLFHGWVGSDFRPAPTVDPLPVRVVAFPWTVLGGGDEAAARDVRSEMIQRLSRDPRLRMVPWEALGPDGDPPLEGGDPGESGGARYILVVAARGEGGDLRLWARLLAPGVEEPLWMGEMESRGGASSHAGMGEALAESLLNGIGDLVPGRV